MPFVVQLSAPSGKTITMKITTRNGTAVAPRDYDADGTVTTLTFAPGQTSKTVTVGTRIDGVSESPEQFQFGYYQQVNVMIGDRIATGTIRKNIT